MNLNNALFFGGTSEIALELSKSLKKSFNITSISRSISLNKNYAKEIKINFNDRLFPKNKLIKKLNKKFSLVIFFQADQPKNEKSFLT